MNGRLEKELQSKEKMHRKLASLPFILTEFYMYMNEDHKSYTTVERYIGYVVDFMNYVTNNKPTDDFYKTVTVNQVRQYFASLEVKEYNGKIVRLGDEIKGTKWSAINTFFNFLMQEDYIDTNPMVKTKRPKVKTKHEIVYLTQEEIQSVLDSIEENARPMLKNRDLCIVSLGLSTGLRVSAITQINVEDIDFTTNKIKVIEKGNVTKEVGFGNKMRAILLNWIKDREVYFEVDDTGALFVSQQNKRMCTDAIRDLITKYTSHLNKHIAPHKLRSTAAMNLVQAGADVLTIQAVLGHENINTTLRYVQAVEQEKQKATNILDNLI